MVDRKKIKAVILDLDQTLTNDTGSWIQFTSLLGANFETHLDIYNKFKAGDISYSEAKKRLIELWKSRSKLDRETIKGVLSRIGLREGMVDAVKYLNGKYKLCIISGAIDVYVQFMAEKLNIDDYYASTHFIFDENDELIDFDYTLLRGEEKLAFFKEFCKKNGIKPEECAAIGDGESDMPIFKEVSLPILFIAQETSDDEKNLIKVHMESWEKIRRVL